MSIEVMKWVWEHSPTTGGERLVLLAIADYANSDGTNAYPSRKVLAEKTRLDARTVQRLIRSLEESGHLLVRRNRRAGRTNLYTVLMPPRSLGDGPVDNGEARHPTGTAPRGGSGSRGRADHLITRGEMPPEPPTTVNEPSSSVGADAVPAAADPPLPPLDRVAAAVLHRLGPAWPLTDIERHHLAPLITDAVISGWPVKGLVAYLSANPKGVRSPAAVLASRLENLPQPGRKITTPPARPQWCGSCDETTRLVEAPGNRLYRCPACHPLREVPVDPT